MNIVNVNLDALTTEQTLTLAKRVINELPDEAMQEWLEAQM